MHDTVKENEILPVQHPAAKEGSKTFDFMLCNFLPHSLDVITYRLHLRYQDGLPSTPGLIILLYLFISKATARRRDQSEPNSSRCKRRLSEVAALCFSCAFSAEHDGVAFGPELSPSYEDWRQTN